MTTISLTHDEIVIIQNLINSRTNIKLSGIAFLVNRVYLKTINAEKDNRIKREMKKIYNEWVNNNNLNFKLFKIGGKK